MRERLRLVNGSFIVKSSPGKGTTLEVEIPSIAKATGNLQKPLVRLE
jgi:signal transduction histidine kinase